MTVGGTHHDQDFIYGLAVNKAYEIERKIATTPRTLVSDEVLCDVKAYGSQFEELLTEDADGRYFVHYLKMYSDYITPPDHPELEYIGAIILDDNGRRIVDFICHRLNIHSDPKVLEKDIWFQKYWNDKVAVRGVFGRIESGVTIRDLGHGPFRAIRRIAGPLTNRS